MKKICILVSCHKPSKTLKNKYIKPIQVGTAINRKKIENFIHDDEGDNISDKNKRYCELTAQYWAWKNIDVDYYGFFHYRRYLSFARKKYFRVPFHDVKVKKIDVEMYKKFGLNENNLLNFVENYDVIVPKRSFCFSNYYHYMTANGHHIRDLNFCLEIIKKDYPQMYNFAKKYMRSGFAYFCNIFVMKKDIFNEYCQWLFDILEKHEKRYPCVDYNEREYRVSGFLAERLFGIYITWLKEKKGLRIKHVQRIKIRDTSL